MVEDDYRVSLYFLLKFMDSEPITGACDCYAWIHNYFTVLSRPKNSDFFLPYIEILDSFLKDHSNALVGILKGFCFY